MDDDTFDFILSSIEMYQRMSCSYNEKALEDWCRALQRIIDVNEETLRARGVSLPHIWVPRH